MNCKAWIRAAVFAVVALAAGLALPCGQAAAGSHGLDSAAQALRDELQRVGMERFTGPDYKPGLVRHIVMFQYKAGTSEAIRRQIRQQFLAMQQTARRHGRPYILSIETGVQNSGEGADQGLQEAFLVTFRSVGDRNYYVGTPVVTTPAYYEPVHESFKHFALPYVQRAVVFDYIQAAAEPTISVP